MDQPVHQISPRVLITTYDYSSTDLSVLSIDAWEVYLIDKLDGRWLVWIVIAAVHLKGVDSVLVDAL